MLRYFPSITTLLRVFIMTEYWILSNIEFYQISLLRQSWFLTFILLIWYIILINLWMLNYPCIPEINYTWSWCMIFLTCCWIRFANFFVEKYASVFIKYIGLQFCFRVMCHSGFGIRLMLVTYNEFRNCFSPFLFVGKSWEGLVFIPLNV